ncbi:hypothetical protein BGZ80_006403 [Entomortierella chlamydospora]|uniref:Uncharacterized protein n=1 Tax=Entomortierella chlamydospora TaxID=101097 RepID=A0A9P6MZX5_9FUNG|nr:hypothetical protein BGZ80_006403 [Entomortierella chlamydospora]
MVKANPFEDGILDAISILANSSNGVFQMSAVLALGEFLGKIDVKILKPLLQLHKSSNIEVKTLH